MHGVSSEQPAGVMDMRCQCEWVATMSAMYVCDAAVARAVAAAAAEQSLIASPLLPIGRGSSWESRTTLSDVACEAPGLIEPNQSPCGVIWFWHVADIKRELYAFN